MWRSIDESGPETVVVLRGSLATKPASYARFYRRRRWLTPGGVAVFFQRLISWSIALTAHLLAVALFLALYYEVTRQDETPVWAAIHSGEKGGDEGKEVETPPAPEPPKEVPKVEEPPPPEPPKPEPVKPEPVKEVLKPVEKPAEAAPNPAAALAVESPKPATIGAGASSAGAPAKGDVSDKEVEKDPTEAIRKRRAGELARLRGGSRHEIVVVTGCYDRVQDVLSRLEIPHTVIEESRLPHHDLSKSKALLINCDNRYASWTGTAVDVKTMHQEILKLEELEDEVRRQMDKTKDKTTLYKLNLRLMDLGSRQNLLKQRLESGVGSSRTTDKLRDFVQGGGYVFTSDWGLTLVERAFPGYVKNGGNVGPKTVTIRAAKGKERNPLLEEVFYTGGKAGQSAVERKFLWEIDSTSYLIKPEKPSVEILVESPMVARWPAVAVAFSPDGSEGRVLHVLSHFQKQATQQGDYALQNMLLNFLFERVAGKGVRAAPGVAAPAPAPIEIAASDVYRDPKGRFAVPVPAGWVPTAGSAEIPLTMADASGGTFLLRSMITPGGLLDGTGSWEDFLRDYLRAAPDRKDVQTTRRTPAFCSGHPAYRVSWRYAAGGKALGATEYFVATPAAFYVLSWEAPAERFAELEPIFDKACRGFTVPPKP
jgi:hypothetical protein